MLRNAKVILIALVIFAIAGSAYAFAATNSMPADADVGYGTTSVSGYEITNIVYDIVDATPSTVDVVTFTIDPDDAVFIQIQIDASGSWENCTNAAGTVTCTLSSAYDITDIDVFNAVASSAANPAD